MSSGIIIEQRDIVLIPLPFTDLSGRKKRPVLVISRDEFNALSEDIIVVQITSKLTSGFQEYNVVIDNNDLEVCYGKPIIKSLVKPYRIFTIDKRKVTKKIGKLSEKKFEEVLEKLVKILLVSP